MSRTSARHRPRPPGRAHTRPTARRGTVRARDARDTRVENILCRSLDDEALCGARVCIINNINDMFTGSRARPLKTDRRDPVSVSAIFTRLCVCDPPFFQRMCAWAPIAFFYHLFFSIFFIPPVGKRQLGKKGTLGMTIHRAWPRARAQVWLFRDTFA